MTVEAEGDQSVTAPQPPVAVTPEAPTIDLAEYQRLVKKLDLVQQDKLRAGETNQQLNARLKDLERQIQSRDQQQLQDQGEYKTLWDDAKATIAARDQEIADLRAQLESVTHSVAQERLKATAVTAISKAGAISPEQMYALLQTQLRELEGKPVVLAGGAEQPLDFYLSNLKAPGSGYEHHFSATGARGMGTSAPSSAAPGLTNPYITGNLTERIRLEAENSELAKALKAEAQRG
jgi:cell division septum initiation protein DivIVA